MQQLDHSAGDVRAPERRSDSAGDPVVRNGYLLAVTSLLTAGLGVAYWAVAARMSSPEEVGRSAATITALTLVANVAGLNLTGSFGYLLPRLGRSSRRFVAGSYLLTAALATVLGLAVLGVVAAIGTSPLDYLVGSPLAAVLFVVAAPVFVLFAIQDGVLIGLRRADWVLGENLTFAVGKLAALVVLLALGVAHGIAYSWIGATAVLVPVLTALIFTRLLRADGAEPDGERLSPRDVRRFVGLQHAGALVGQLMMNLLPLVVLGLLGSTANGLFYVPWTIAITVDLISHSMGSSLTVEGASDPAQLGRHVRSISRKLAVLLGAGGLVGLVVAPEVLRIYGAAYAGNGTLLLRLLIVGALFRAVVVVAQSAARARGRTALNLVTESATCVLVLGVSAVLLPVLGIEAAGWAWLGGNALVAAASLPSLVAVTRSSGGAGAEVVAAAATATPPAAERGL
jgi:O-antigen/teichoic acid export membrane protein